MASSCDYRYGSAHDGPMMIVMASLCQQHKNQPFERCDVRRLGNNFFRNVYNSYGRI